MPRVASRACQGSGVPDSDERVVLPNLDAVRDTFLEQCVISRLHSWGYPGALLIGSRRGGAGSYNGLKTCVNGYLENAAANTLAQASGYTHLPRP